MTYWEKNEGKESTASGRSSAFRNVSGARWWAVSVVRSLAVPPSFRGPREERGVRGDPGSPEPGFDWLRCTMFEQDSLTSLERVYVWGSTLSLCCLLADDGESDGYGRRSEAAESINRWGNSAKMLSLWIVSNPIFQNLKLSNLLKGLLLWLYLKKNGLHLLLQDILSKSFIKYFKEVQHTKWQWIE